jgi:tetratricopeptide (TPR) repeat protein
MDQAFAQAFDDFEQVLRINPRVVAALRGEIRIAFAGSAHRRELKTIARRAFSSCPACYQVRAVLQYGLEPRWGGSYDAMERAARAANPALNAKFRLLAGYADRDRAQVADHDDKPDEALAEIERACALGDNADFLLDKAGLLSRREDYAGELAALSRALDSRPQRTDLLFDRAEAYLRGKAPNAQAAYEDLLLGLRIEPTASRARAALPYVAGALTRLAEDALRRNEPREALRYFDEAFDLAPSQQLESRRSAALTAGFHGTEVELDALTQAANAAPNDFYAHQRLDYALSTFQRWAQIVAMWTAFIANNPADGHAYYERSGTYSHMPGMREASKADVVRACDLGVNPACVLASRL